MLEDSISSHGRQPIQFTQTSGLNQNTLSSNVDFTDLNFGDEEGSEFEESEAEISESLRNIEEPYESTEGNHSLVERTPYTDSIENRSRVQNSLASRTNERGEYTESRGEYDDYEGEDYYESEEEEEESANIESQISGLDSLSQTRKSKRSSNNFQKSKNYGRKYEKQTNFDQNHTVSSKFNDTDDSRGYPFGNESLGNVSKNERNNDTISCAQSKDSWGAETPNEAIVEPRTAKEEDKDQFVYFKSPGGKSLILDESVANDRPGFKNSQETDNYRGSNLHNDSDLFNSRTVTRSKRMEGKLGNIQEDRELTNILRDEELHQSKNHISLNKGYERQFMEGDEGGEEQSIEQRKLVIENRKLRVELAKVTSSMVRKNEFLERSESKVNELFQKLHEEECCKNELADKFHVLKSKTKGISEIERKRLNLEKLKQARKQIQVLKNQNSQYEGEIEFLRGKA